MAVHFGGRGTGGRGAGGTGADGGGGGSGRISVVVVRISRGGKLVPGIVAVVVVVELIEVESGG